MGTTADFWAQVEHDQCWVWQGSIGTGGYGYATRADTGRPVRAHRYAYELTYGPIPSGMVVKHKCDNPPCVRPDHLQLGTQKENIADCVTRGRRARSYPNGGLARRGQRNGNSKLTADQVQAIRRRFTDGASLTAVACEFGISKSHASRLRRGVAWQDVTE